MKIAVAGTGYVGLVVGACLAEKGDEVVCVDKEGSTIAARVQTPVIADGGNLYSPGPLGALGFTDFSIGR